MGNLFSTEATEDRPVLDEYKKKLYELDHQMCSFLFAMDLMGENIRELEARILCKEEKPADENVSQIVKRLATTSKWTMQEQKNRAAKLLLSSLKFMIAKIEENAASINVKKRELDLENYCNANDVTGEHHWSIKDYMGSLLKESQEQTEKNELLQEQRNSCLILEQIQREKNESLEKDIAKLKEKEMNLLVQLQNKSKKHRGRSNKYETQIRENNNELKDLKKANTGLEREKEKYLSKICQLQEKNKICKEKLKEATEKNLSMSVKLKEKQKLVEELPTNERDSMGTERNVMNVEQEVQIKGLKETLEDKEKQLKANLESYEMEMQKLKDTHEREKSQTKENINKIEKELQNFNENQLKVNSGTYETEIEKLKDTHKQEKSIFKENIEQMEKELKQLKTKSENDEKEIAKLNYTHEREKRQTNDTIEKLKKEAQIAADKRVLELESKDAAITKLMSSASEREDYLESKIEYLNDEIEKHKKSLEDEKSHFESLHEKSKTLKIENETLTKKINKLERHCYEQECTMKTTLISNGKYKRQMQEKERNLYDERQKLLNLEKDLRTMRSDLQKIQFEFASQENDLLETKTELKYTLTNLTKTSENLSLKTEELRNLELKLSEEIDMKTNEVDSLRQQIELLKRKKRLPVQLLCNKSSDLTKQLETSLEDLFRREFLSDRLELEFWKCSRPSDIQPEYPLLVTCLTASRLGTDVTNALQGITLSPSMAIVIFHHKDEHALPNQLSERVLTGKNFQDIGGIYDMAYFSDKGIYTCEMNSNSTKSLMTFVKRVASELKL